jgi:hypothetical protein
MIGILSNNEGIMHDPWATPYTASCAREKGAREASSPESNPAETGMQAKIISEPK